MNPEKAAQVAHFVGQVRKDFSDPKNMHHIGGAIEDTAGKYKGRLNKARIGFGLAFGLLAIAYAHGINDSYERMDAQKKLHPRRLVHFAGHTGHAVAALGFGLASAVLLEPVARYFVKRVETRVEEASQASATSVPEGLASKPTPAYFEPAPVTH